MAKGRQTRRPRAGKARKLAKTRRLLEIQNLILKEPGKYKVTDLARVFKVTPRSIQRDLKLLRESGVLIEKDASGRLVGGKDLTAQVEMLRMSEIVMVVAVRNAISSIAPFVKDDLDKILSTMMDPEVYEHVVVGLDYAIEMDEELASLFNLLIDAISSKKLVRFKYGEEKRDIETEPYKLGYDKGFWYLIGGHKVKGDLSRRRLVRSYALDKMSQVEMLPDSYNHHEVPPQVREMEVFRPYFSDDKPVKVKVRVSPYAVKYFDRKKFVQGQRKLEELPTGEAVFELEASSYYEIKNTVIKPWQPHVKVVEPEQLAKEVFIELETWIQGQKRLFLEKRRDHSPELEDRFCGSMLGLAVGNALGMSIEFSEPGTFQPVVGLRRREKLPPGCWGGDTSSALCLAHTLLEKGEFDASVFLETLVRWANEGEFRSVDGFLHSAGPTVEAAIERFEKTGTPPIDPLIEEAGNAPLARLAPVVLFYSHDPAMAIEMAAESAKATHLHGECIDACRYFAGLLIGALGGVEKRELLSPGWSPVGKRWQEGDLHPRIWEVAQGSFKDKEPPEIKGSTEVAEALEAALWAFHKGIDYEECVLRTVNLGNDADTVGAICGQLAGAYYGIQGIPPRWWHSLCKVDEVKRYAERLFEVVEGR